MEKFPNETNLDNLTNSNEKKLPQLSNQADLFFGFRNSVVAAAIVAILLTTQAGCSSSKAESSITQKAEANPNDGAGVDSEIKEVLNDEKDIKDDDLYVYDSVNHTYINYLLWHDMFRPTTILVYNTGSGYVPYTGYRSPSSWDYNRTSTVVTTTSDGKSTFGQVSGKSVGSSVNVKSSTPKVGSTIGKTGSVTSGKGTSGGKTSISTAKSGGSFGSGKSGISSGGKISSSFGGSSARGMSSGG